MLLDDRSREPSPVAKALAFVVGLVLLVLGFMFSLVLLAIAAVAVAGAWGYLWWKTRELRRRLRARGPTMPADGGAGGQVFDGEATRVDEAEHRQADS